MNKLSISYSIPSEEVMNPTFAPKLALMKKAGVTDLWLWGMFSGRSYSPADVMADAKKRLENLGFNTGVVMVPVGHPGNSLDPNNPDLELALPHGWTYRTDRTGKPVFYCGCVNDLLIDINAADVRRYAQIGFDRVFLDDDARIGNWRGDIQGCYCDACMDEFNRITGSGFTRGELAAELEKADRANTSEKFDIANLSGGEFAVARKWIDYNCEKLTKFVKACSFDGMRAGLMVMHDGDRRHGIDIPRIFDAVPDAMIRVGELHFNDSSFVRPEDKRSLLHSALTHARITRAASGNPEYPEIYSETTVFPAGDLSPENLVLKAKLEITAGIPKLFLMGGTAMFDDAYWHAFAKAKTELCELRERYLSGIDGITKLSVSEAADKVSKIFGC